MTVTYDEIETLIAPAFSAGTLANKATQDRVLLSLLAKTPLAKKGDVTSIFNDARSIGLIYGYTINEICRTING